MDQKVQGEASDRRLAPPLPTKNCLGNDRNPWTCFFGLPYSHGKHHPTAKYDKKRETSEFLRKQTGELPFTQYFNASFILNKTPQSLPRKISRF